MTAINRSALNRNSASSLLKKLKESTEKKPDYKKDDDTQWQPTADANGNGFAVIRFLPAKTEDSLPFIQQYSHGFEENGRWFINLCPSTIGLPSPVGDLNRKLWNSGLESDKELVRKRKRRTNYFANVYIVKDPKNPEAEGQVKLFRYGKKLHEKLMSAMNPPEDFGEEPINPFSFFDGAVMKIKIKKKDGYRTYEDTVVEPAPDLFDGDEDKLIELFDKMTDLESLNAPDKFKSYEELSRELARVLGEEVASEDSPVRREHEERKRPERNTEYAAEVQEERVTKQKEEESSSSVDEDDDLAMFRSLAQED